MSDQGWSAWREPLYEAEKGYDTETEVDNSNNPRLLADPYPYSEIPMDRKWVARDPVRRSTAKLYLGGFHYATTELIPNAAQTGIKAVYWLLGPSNRQPRVAKLRKAGIAFSSQCVEDTGHDRIDLFPAIAFLRQHLDRGHGVYVHCQSGISRSPTVVIAYLMMEQSYYFREARLAVRFYRPWISPNISFTNQLRGLGQLLAALEVHLKKRAARNVVYFLFGCSYLYGHTQPKIKPEFSRLTAESHKPVPYPITLSSIPRNPAPPPRFLELSGSQLLHDPRLF